MGKQEVVLFSSEEKTSRQHTVSFLRELADKLETGAVTLKQAGNELTVNIPANVTLEIKVEDETGKSGNVKHSLEVETRMARRR